RDFPCGKKQSAICLPPKRKVEIIKTKKPIMSYLQDTADELLAIIEAGTQDDESDAEFLARVKHEIKDKLLESYRNGQKAGDKPGKDITGAEVKKKPWYRRQK